MFDFERLIAERRAAAEAQKEEAARIVEERADTTARLFDACEAFAAKHAGNVTVSRGASEVLLEKSAASSMHITVEDGVRFRYKITGPSPDQVTVRDSRGHPGQVGEEEITAKILDWAVMTPSI